MNEAMLKQLVWFVMEREHIRILKEAGAPKPWTKDSMLQQYRFCNIRREDDKVSRWIYDNWIQPYADHPNLLGAIVLARMINWPDTLAEIGFPEKWNPMEYVDKIRARIARGDKTWTGAYIITAESNGNPKEVSVCRTVTEAMTTVWDATTCLDMWKDLQTLPRIGSFMSAQFVADLKRTHILGAAEDKDTFCAPGPGSQRGLNYLLDCPHKEWKQPEFQGQVNILRTYIPIPLDAHNTQNCLCEFSKYQRGYARTTYPGSR